MLKRRLKEPFGKAGLTVAILALVLAMVGGAYAAGGLTKSQEKQVTKIAKKYAGKPGAAGANGTNGAAGAKGDIGATGGPGGPGEPGKGVITTNITTAGLEGKCVSVGGTKVEVEGAPASKKYICNGSPGVIHPGETLPFEASEYGTWATVVGAKEGGFGGVEGFAPIATSFNIPLSASLSVTDCNTPQSASCQVHFITETGGKEGVENGLTGELEEVAQRNPAPCPGTAQAPEAEPGNLCIYMKEGKSAITEFTGPHTALSTVGGVALPQMIFGVTPGNSLDGTWAVTAG